MNWMRLSSIELPEKIRPLVKNGEVQILPQYFNSDGFYIACLRKKGKSQNSVYNHDFFV